MDIASLLFYGAVALWSAFAAYVFLERFVPLKEEEAASPASVQEQARPAALARTEPVAPAPAISGRFNPSEGFKSFQTGAELTVEDIVKGLTR